MKALSMKPVWNGPAPKDQLMGGIGNKILSPERIEELNKIAREKRKALKEKHEWEKFVRDTLAKGAVSTTQLKVFDGE